MAWEDGGCSQAAPNLALTLTLTFTLTLALALALTLTLTSAKASAATSARPLAAQPSRSTCRWMSLDSSARSYLACAVVSGMG